MRPRYSHYGVDTAGRRVSAGDFPLAAALAILLLAGCGRSISGWPFTAASPESAGQIAGTVMRGPGVDPRSGGSGDLVPVAGDTVRAQDAQGRTLAQAVSARDGSFTMRVSPGVYTVVEDICGVKAQADVRSQAVTQLTLKIPNSC